MLAILFMVPCWAQPPGGVEQPPAEGELPTNRPKGPPVDANGYVHLGTVRFHHERKEVEADGWINMRYGFLEFLATAPGVKSHESLVALDIEPSHLKAALLILGLKDAPNPKSEVDLRPIPGDRVMIFLRWKQKDKDGKEVTVTRRAEECIFNALVEESMEPVGWVFTGSDFIQEPVLPDRRDGGAPRDATDVEHESPNGESPESGVKDDESGGKDETPPKMREVFGAKVTGQYIAVGHRPFALLDNPLGLPFPDPDYYADPDALPPKVAGEERTPVTLIFRLPRPGEIDKTITHMKVPPPPKEKEEPADKSDESKSDG